MTDAKPQSPSPLRGHVGNLTSEEETILSQMRERAQTLGPKLEADDVEIDDGLLLRFLRARNFDINLSFPMLQECWEWRRNFQGIGAVNITEESIQNELKSDKGFFHNYDKEDRPVFYVRVRLHDSNTRNLEECQRFCIYNMERGRKMMKPPGETVCLIFDLGGFAMKNMDYQFVKFLIEIFEKYYPESLGVGLVLNAPWIFSACWAVIKPWLPPVTAQKVQFVNTSQLTTYIDKDSLHPDYK